MPRPLRLILPLLLLLATASCSVIHVLLATVADGTVSFVPRNARAAAARSCAHDLELLDEDGKVFWRVAAAQGGSAGPRPCAAFAFPLAYGRAPSGMETLVGPEPLEDGRLYVVRAAIAFEGRLGTYSGAAFRYRAGPPPAVENVRYGSREHGRLMRRLGPAAR